MAEAPAKNEDSQNVGLVGQTGMEFNDGYLPIARLFRPNVHVTNAVLCSQPNYRNPKPHEAIICSGHHLSDLLDQVQPEIIITMGAVAAVLFPNIQLNLHHGIPQKAKYGNWEGIVLATYHPSAGMRSTAYMIPLRSDFEALGLLLRQLDSGTFSWPSDPYPFTDYSVISSVKDLSSYLESGVTYYEIGMDTEARPGTIPYCLTLSHTPSTGRLIYAHNLPVLMALASYIRHFRPQLIFHNWLYDQKPCGEMGIPVDRFLDTMIRAYELGLGGGGDEDEGAAARGSLGLKTLAYRHLHMEMQSFRDLVVPHTIPLVLDYLSKALNLVVSSAAENGPMCNCGHPQSAHQPRGKTERRTGRCEWTDNPYCGCQKYQKVVPPKPDKAFGLLGRKLKTLSHTLQLGLVDTSEDPQDQAEDVESDDSSSSARRKVDPWKRFNAWHPWERDLLTEFIGPFPSLDIALVPENELLGYACRDPDATLRLNSYLNTVKLR